MRSIDRSRRVDAICAAQSWKRISIRDSVNCQSRGQNQKNHWIHWFLTNILWFSTKRCLQPSYFGCPEINYERLFSRIISRGFNQISSSWVSGTCVWLFIELSELIFDFLIFSFFLNEFDGKIIGNPCISWKSNVWTKKCMVSRIFSHQNH